MPDKSFTLDNYDKKIIYELDKDSSISISQLSKKIRRSKQFTLFRLKRLEDRGIITGYTAIIDMAKLGFFTFRIYIKFRQMTRNELEKSVEYLKTLENVWTIAICHGKWDLAIFVGAKKIEDVHKVWDEFLSHYKHKVENYNFSLYSPIYNFNRAFFFEDEKVTKEKILRIYGESKIVKVDETDWRIITTYAPNVKQSILELSRKLHLSTETIKKRIKKMRKNGIICGYKIGLDVNKLGYTSYRIDLDLISTARNKELLNFCATHKGIYQINKTIGGADFEIEIIVRDLNELLDVIETIKTDFKDVVNNATYFSYSTYYLLNYIPD